MGDGTFTQEKILCGRWEIVTLAEVYQSLRSLCDVGISGCNFKPTIPKREEVEGNIKRILSSYVSSTEKALDPFCFITYNQLFWAEIKVRRWRFEQDAS